MKLSKWQMEADATLSPRFDELGFVPVSLTGCMCPAVLFNKSRLWFGASWNIRQRRFDISLGHLFWFDDVMPRVIVLGSYGRYCPGIDAISLETDECLNEVASFVASTIEDAIKLYSDNYDMILGDAKNPTKLKYAKEFFMHLGKEVTAAELTRFAT